MQALQDAVAALQEAPGQPHGHIRLARACMELGEWAEARAAAQAGLSIAEDGSAADKAALDQLLDAAQHAQACAQLRARAGLNLVMHDVSSALAHARQASQEARMAAQLSEALGAPGKWVPEDWGWGPTWVAEARMPPPPGQHTQAAAGDAGDAEARALLAQCAAGLASLDRPLQGLKAAADPRRLAAYSEALRAAVKASRPGAHVLALGHSATLLALLAAGAGCGRATAIERCPLSYHAGTLLLAANTKAAGAATVQLVPAPLALCRLKQDGAGGGAPASGSDSGPFHLIDGGPVDVLVTDLFDHSVVGGGATAGLAAAAAAGLVHGGTLVLPSRVTVMAQLVQASWVGFVQGFDLSPMNACKWFPGPQPVEAPFAGDLRVPLTAPFQAATLDLQRLLQAACSCSSAPEGGLLDTGRVGADVQVAATASGVCNALLTWPRLEFGAAGQGGGCLECTSLPHGLLGLDTRRVVEGQAVTLGVLVEGPRAVRVAEAASSASGSSSSSSDGSQEEGATARGGGGSSSSSGSASSNGGGSSSSGVWRCCDAALHVRGPLPLAPSPVRAAPLLPDWHFSMVLDRARNAAYEAALQLVISRQRARKQLMAGAAPDAPLVLDVGAGTGLLSLMAARLGGAVCAVESSGAMVGLCEQVLGLNNAGGRVRVVHKDGRHLDASADLGTPADVLVFEVFDVGLLGEGVLHILSAAGARGLLAAGAECVPCKAKVFCQLIELNPCGGAPACGGAAPLDLRAWEAFQWAPEYTGKDLAHTGPQGPDGFYACPAGRWRPLTQPAEAMSFDFKQVALCGRHMQPEQRQVRLQCTATGRANAVAFWFELQLVEEAGPGGSIRLSTGPFEKADGGRTWQVAVQQLGTACLPVQQGVEVALTARHDTYALRFELPGAAASAASTAAQPVDAAAAGPPAHERGADPAWLAHYRGLQALSAHIGKAGAQDPLVLRRLTRAALAMAARPGEHGVEAAQAAQLAARMCG